MKTKRNLLLFSFVLCALSLQPSAFLRAAPLGTAFTYQGRLDDRGNPARGIYDFQFTIYDSLAGGSAVGGPVTNSATDVSNGLFTTTINFGAGVFAGDARWLQVAVRSNGAAADFMLLSPRQPLAPSPYALFAANAGTAATTLGTASGVVSNFSLAANAVTSDKIADGAIAPADLSPALASNTFWRLSGNAGTTPGAQFLGTSDNQPLELRVNNRRFLRAVATTNSPNLLGGASANQALPGAGGAVIAGGGEAAEPNVVGGAFSFVGGGRGNAVQSDGAESAIVGGRQNKIYTNVWGASIGGGNLNFIDSFSDFAVIGGGANNFVSFYAAHAGISGGQYNSIGDEAALAFIAGGADNSVGSNAVASAVVGGQLNRIGEDSEAAFIGGGLYNTNFGSVSFIGGGLSNLISSASFAATVGGGYLNSLADAAEFSTIAGGSENIMFWVTHGTIGGGFYNYMEDSADYATVAGGADNWVKTGAAYSTIPGGAQAAAISYGQMAYASGMYDDWGDAQASLYVLRTVTTNSATRELFLDGTAAAERIQVPLGGAWTFQIMIVARNNSGSAACFKAEGGIKNVGGTVSLIGAPTVTQIASEIGGLGSPQAQADNVNKALVVRGTGLSGQQIRWVARVQTVELKF